MTRPRTKLLVIITFVAVSLSAFSFLFTHRARLLWWWQTERVSIEVHSNGSATGEYRYVHGDLRGKRVIQNMASDGQVRYFLLVHEESGAVELGE